MAEREQTNITWKEGSKQIFQAAYEAWCAKGQPKGAGAGDYILELVKQAANKEVDENIADKIKAAGIEELAEMHRRRVEADGRMMAAIADMVTEARSKAEKDVRAEVLALTKNLDVERKEKERALGERDAATEAKEKAEKQATESQAALTEAEEKIKLLDTEIKAKKADLEEAEKAVKIVQEEAKEAREKEAKAREEENEAKKREVEVKEAALAEKTRAEKAEIEAKQTAMERDALAKDLEREKADKLQKTSALEDQLEAVKRDLEAAKEKAKSLQATLAATEEKASKMSEDQKNKIHSFEVKIAELTATLQSKNEVITALQSGMDLVRNKINEGHEQTAPKSGIALVKKTQAERIDRPVQKGDMA